MSVLKFNVNGEEIILNDEIDEKETGIFLQEKSDLDKTIEVDFKIDDDENTKIDIYGDNNE